MDRKIALITGGTRGIGLAIARELQDDYHLIIGGSSEKAYDVASQFPSAQGFVADLADTEGIGAAVAELGLDSLDVLVHSAGVVAHDPVTETTPEQWKRAFDINLFAVCLLYTSDAADDSTEV